MLGSQGIGIQREGCHKTGQMDWLSSSPDGSSALSVALESGREQLRAIELNLAKQVPCLSVVLVSGMIDPVHPPQNARSLQPLMPFFHGSCTFT